MSYIFDKIKQKHRIPKYLASKGIFPKNGESSDTLLYCCPLPGHSDKTASFIVYVKEDIDDYFCWGCKRHGCIVNLYSELEGISVKSSVSQLGDGMKIDSENHLNSIINEILNQSTAEPSPSENIEISFTISDLMYRFLDKVNFDLEELKIAEDLYQKVDEMVLFNMRKELLEIESLLPDYLEKRIVAYQNKQDILQIENIKDINSFRNIH